MLPRIGGVLAVAVLLFAWHPQRASADCWACTLQPPYDCVPVIRGGDRSCIPGDLDTFCTLNTACGPNRMLADGSAYDPTDVERSDALAKSNRRIRNVNWERSSARTSVRRACNGAIVAREYGAEAVAALRAATHRITL